MWSMLLNVVDVVLVVNVLIMNDAVLIIFLFPPMAVAAVALDVEIAFENNIYRDFSILGFAGG